MSVGKVCDEIAQFFIDPLNHEYSTATKVFASISTAIAVFCTLGLAQGLSALWRNLRHVEEPNDTHEKIKELYHEIFGDKADTEGFKTENGNKDNKEIKSVWEDKFYKPSAPPALGNNRNDEKDYTLKYEVWVKPIQEALEKHSLDAKFDLVIPVTVYRHRDGAFGLEGHYHKMKDKMYDPKTLVIYVTDNAYDTGLMEQGDRKCGLGVLTWDEYYQLPNKIPEKLKELLKNGMPE